MRRLGIRLGSLLVAVALVVSLQGAVGASARAGRTKAAAPARSDVVKVKVRDFYFSPKKVTIEKGDKVRWNSSGMVHTVTANDGSFDSGNLASGQKFTFKFRDTGVFKYTCEIHGFKGKVVVE